MESLEMSESQKYEDFSMPVGEDDEDEKKKSSSSSAKALNKIEKFLTTPTRKIGNNSVEPEPIKAVDYPILSSSPFHLKRKDLLHADRIFTPPATRESFPKDQERLTPAVNADSTRSYRGLPCGLTNFHLSLFFGIIGFILFWLVLLLRIYLPDNYFEREYPNITRLPIENT